MWPSFIALKGRVCHQGGILSNNCTSCVSLLICFPSQTAQDFHFLKRSRRDKAKWGGFLQGSPTATFPPTPTSKDFPILLLVPPPPPITKPSQARLLLPPSLIAATSPTACRQPPSQENTRSVYLGKAPSWPFSNAVSGHACEIVPHAF